MTDRPGPAVGGPLSRSSDAEITSPFSRRSQSVFELELQLRKVALGKAYGMDALPSELLHSSSAYLSHRLWPLLMKMTARVQEPLQYKGGKLIALFKQKGSAMECSSYRAILVSSALGKALHNVYRARAVPYLQAQAVLGAAWGHRRHGRPHGEIGARYCKTSWSLRLHFVSRYSFRLLHPPSRACSRPLLWRRRCHLLSTSHADPGDQHRGCGESDSTNACSGSFRCTPSFEGHGRWISQPHLVCSPRRCRTYWNLTRNPYRRRVRGYTLVRHLQSILEGRGEQIGGHWSNATHPLERRDWLAGGTWGGPDHWQTIMGKGKTELITTPRGKGKTAVRQFIHHHCQGHIRFETESTTETHLRVVPHYPHLGGQLSHCGRTKGEIRRRLVIARDLWWTSHRRYIWTRWLAWTHGSLSSGLPLGQLWPTTLVLSCHSQRRNDLHGTAVWCASIDWYFGSYTFDFVYHSRDADILNLTGLPHPMDALRLCRLRYFGQALGRGNNVLWALVGDEQGWLAEVKDDMDWMYQQIHRAHHYASSPNRPGSMAWPHLDSTYAMERATQEGGKACSFTTAIEEQRHQLPQTAGRHA